MKSNYSNALGAYDNFCNEHQDAMTEVTVVSSQCKLVEVYNAEVKANDHRASKWVCACGKDDAFRIFCKGYATIAQCSACGNEKVVYES